MDDDSIMESCGNKDSISGQSPVTKLQQPKLNVGDPPCRGVTEQSSRVTAGTREAAAEKKHECRQSLRRAEWLASLGMVSATLAHELIQPLSVAQLVIQDAWKKLEGLDCPGGVRQDLQDALTACSRINELINSFRTLARHPGKSKETEVHIQRVAERTIHLLEQSAKQARMRLWAENLDALPTVRMPENDLDQVFFALAQNAVQAADGTKDRHLLIAGTRRDDSVVLQFQDNCGGVDPAHLPRIFDPFFTTKPSGKGMGLGLCIARRIVCRRGGQISVNSQPGEGTTFTVTLPRASSPGGRGQYVR